MARFVTLLLVLLLGMSGTLSPAPKSGACPMPGPRAGGECAYCAPTTLGAPMPGAAKLEAGCCRFQSGQESNALQAASLGSHPKPLQSPDWIAALPGVSAAVLAAARALPAGTPSGQPPPHASPTRTTHLLL